MPMKSPNYRIANSLNNGLMNPGMQMGFGVPIDTWLRGPLFKWAEERFLDPSYYIGLPIDQKKCVNLFRLHQTGKRNVHPLLWAILMLLEFNSRNYKHV